MDKASFTIILTVGPHREHIPDNCLLSIIWSQHV